LSTRINYVEQSCDICKLEVCYMHPLDGLMGGLMDECVDECVDECINGWMDGWMDG